MRIYLYKRFLNIVKHAMGAYNFIKNIFQTIKNLKNFYKK